MVLRPAPAALSLALHHAAHEPHPVQRALLSLPRALGSGSALYTEETSEGFWIAPGEGYRRFVANEMAMAEPAEYGLGYLAQFASLDDVWAAHADGRHKFHGIIDRIDVFWEKFDWKQNRWPT